MNRQKLTINSARWLAICLIMACCLITIDGRAQTVLTVSGEVTKPLTLQGADLTAMAHTDVTAKDRDGKEHTYSGIPLVDLLKQAGATMGNELRGENLSKFLIVKAMDGYEVADSSLKCNKWG